MKHALYIALSACLMFPPVDARGRLWEGYTVLHAAPLWKLLVPQKVKQPARSTATPMSLQVSLKELSAVGKNNLWVIGMEPNGASPAHQVLLKSNDGGRTWQRQFSETRQWFYNVCFASPQVGWIVGYEGLLLKSTDGGANWDKQRVPTDAPLLYCQFIDSDHGWAMSEEGIILRTIDGGSNWQAQRIPVGGSLSSIRFVTKDIGWIVGDKGEAYHSTDGGRTWQAQGPKLLNSLPRQENKIVKFWDAKFLSPEVGFIVVEAFPKNEQTTIHRAMLLKTLDGGRTWAPIILSDNEGIASLEVLNEKEMWAKTARGVGLFHTVDGGLTWTASEPVADEGIIKLLRFADPRTGWLIVSDGMFLDKLFYTADGGKTWQRAELPTAPL